MSDHARERVADADDLRRAASRTASPADARAGGGTGPEARLMALQASAGNRAVASLIGSGRRDGAGRPAPRAGMHAVQRAIIIPGMGGGDFNIDAALDRVTRGDARAGGQPRRGGGGLLRMGSRGPKVRMLQEALRDHGAPIAVDGIFGPATRAAVIAYQAIAGLKVDGLVGPQTRASLGLGSGSVSASQAASDQRVVSEISAEVARRLGASGGQVGQGGRGGSIRGSVSVPEWAGGARAGSAGGSYDAGTGSFEGGVSGSLGSVGGSYDAGTGVVTAGGENWRGGSAYGSYDTQTGETSGRFTSSSGRTSGAWSGNVEEGTGSAQIETVFGTGTVAVDGESVHATVDVPGIGGVEVDLPLPSPEDLWL